MPHKIPELISDGARQMWMQKFTWTIQEASLIVCGIEPRTVSTIEEALGLDLPDEVRRRLQRAATLAYQASIAAAEGELLTVKK